MIMKNYTDDDYDSFVNSTHYAPLDCKQFAETSQATISVLNASPPCPTFEICLEKEAKKKHGQDPVHDGQVTGGECWRN